MDYCGVLLVGVVLGAAALGLTACSGPDPGVITFAEKTSTGTSTDQTDTPGGTTPAKDGGTGAGAGHPIFGNDAFAFESPGQNANDHQGTHVGQTPLEGKDCVTAACHLNTSPWSFAGTVYAAIGGGATVSRAEIRVVGPDGKLFGKTYTDTQGNFWLEQATRPPAGSKVGVRKEGGEPKVMGLAVEGATGAACNATAGCHGQATLRIYAP
jgi:hypothetical protein